jgi:hypothetical protein
MEYFIIKKMSIVKPTDLIHFFVLPQKYQINQV